MAITVQQHVHLADGPCAEVLFLPEQAEILRPSAVIDDVFSRLD
jgi:hypothetical protein